MNKLVCFIFGHLWKIKKLSRTKHLALMHLHPYAGCLANCLRCGKVWDDLPNDGRTDFIAHWSEAENL